ncbi:endonuclease/exonuclease/phosphatase family protein [Glaciibacter superstes]|uniref:endonuclease/exonuclease/phosphatase family protein n=1 Tax=Glaciibacter superstes TaxID=501023 RepID=UPI0003B58673|nr:endonuclease/exonuclease/phosphatase family protein [Glaciibacter superstes]
MQPFDGPVNGASGAQVEFDTRRLRYLECLPKRAFLNSVRYASWKEGKDEVTLCDAIAALGLEKLDPGLEAITDALERMPDDQRNDKQREWLLSDKRETALARALLVRAQPERQDELFGWERSGVSPEEYWAKLQVPTVHMRYLLETADFGAHEVLRLVYLLDETPEHLRDAALLWRDAGALARDPNLPESVSTAIRSSYTNFKYWFDDPFRCTEFTGEALKTRSSKALNGHEDMTPGQDMTYWSENHRILFAAAEYLAGQFWPAEQFVSQRANRKEGPNGPLRPGDLTGAQHLAHARRRVLRWLNERLRLGFAEWNAPGYYVEDLLALLNLADLAVDPEVRTRSAMVLDLMVFDLAVNSPTGAFAGSAGRVYFEHKNCVWEQTIRDSSELLFGLLGHFSGSSNAAGFFATSPGYRPPDALIILARHGPVQLTTKGRVSIDFDEAADYGVGTSTDDDMEFWWSRAAYATKETIIGSREVATRNGLLETEPFKGILPMIKKVADAIDTTEDVGAGILGGIGGAVAGFAIAGPVGAVAGGIAGAAVGASAPDFNEVDAADMFSVLTEGSVLSRANLYSHRSGGATLASVQNFRRGQLNFQGMPCVAALENGAMVWTSYPSAGTRVTGSFLFGVIKVDEELFPAGHDGPNWWTGSAVQPRVVQQGGAAITAYKAQSIQEMLFGERTHAWFPKNQFDEVRGPDSARCNHDSARWFFGRSGDSYVALFCALETTWTDDGPWKDKEIRVGGDTNIFITQIGCAAEFGSFERFMAKVSTARVHVSGLHTGAELQCSYDVPFGERLELHYDHGSRYGGELLAEDDYPRHRSQVARIAWQQARYAIEQGKRSLVHDVVKGTRTVGGALRRLEHDTPLTFYAQNMGLLPWPLYKGIDRDAALGAVISRLRERMPDVVGLSEMWTAGDRNRVKNELRDLYPYVIDGPHEPIELVVTDVELMGGGLLLLSRHRIVEGAGTVYRHCSGDDCLSNKGALHARIQRTGSPCAVDVFLTHTQAAAPTVAGTVAGARTAVRAQVRHLAAFIRARRDVVAPAILFGDFNIDSFVHADLYDYLVQSLGYPADLVPVTDARGAQHPSGTSESDDGTISSFHPAHPGRPVDDPARFGDTVERLDYLFDFPGALFTQHVERADVVIEQWSPGRDMSDHYGIQASIDTTTQLFPGDSDLSGIRVTLRRFTCLQTTSGPGDDEVTFTVTAKLARGAVFSIAAPEVEDVSAGTRHEYDLAPMRLPEAGDELSLSVSGNEIDDLSAEDSLGRTRLVFDRQELQALRDAGSAGLAFPVLRGDGAEYVVEIDLEFAP